MDFPFKDPVQAADIVESFLPSEKLGKFVDNEFFDISDPVKIGKS